MLESTATNLIGAPLVMNIHLPVGCSIRKALLILNVRNQENASNIWEPFENKTFSFENQLFHLNPQNFVQGIDNLLIAPTLNESHHYQAIFNVSHLVVPTDTVYVITPPSGQGLVAVGGTIDSYSLLVFYEHDQFPLVCSDNYFATLDAMQYMSYPFTELNPIDLSKPVGFTQNGHAQCDAGDASLLTINTDTLGAIFGSNCGSAQGSFYYENETLYGWRDCTPDSLVHGLDALADIRSYLTGSTAFDALFTFYNPFLPPQAGPGAVTTNQIVQLYLAYSTPCDTFTVNVTADTAICQGEPFHLNASGGQSYLWQPAEGLSCTNCPDPIVSLEKTMHYSVQIWNNDSCSVIRTVKLEVNEISADSLNISPAECNAADGTIEVYNNANFWMQNYIAVDGDTISGLEYAGLTTGFHDLTILDNYGCSWDTLIFIPDTNTTSAQFAVNPTSGEVPFTSEVYDLTNNAQNFNWYINGEYSGNTFEDIAFDAGGEYYIELVAWDFDPACADTFALIILANSIVVPTAFTPDNDQMNDLWELPNVDELYPNNVVHVFSRLGNLLYTSVQGDYMAKPWDGNFNGKLLPSGSYYYVIETNDADIPAQTGSVSIIR